MLSIFRGTPAEFFLPLMVLFVAGRIASATVKEIQFANTISRKTFFLLQKGDMRMSQYLFVRVFRASGQASGGSMRLWASNSGPVIFPFIVQGAIRTLELLRIRLYLPESLRLIT